MLGVYNVILFKNQRIASRKDISGKMLKSQSDIFIIYRIPTL